MFTFQMDFVQRLSWCPAFPLASVSLSPSPFVASRAISDVVSSCHNSLPELTFLPLQQFSSAAPSFSLGNPRVCASCTFLKCFKAMDLKMGAPIGGGHYLPSFPHMGSPPGAAPLPFTAMPLAQHQLHIAMYNEGLYKNCFQGRERIRAHL